MRTIRGSAIGRVVLACALLAFAVPATAIADWNDVVPGPASPAGDPDASFPSAAVVGGIPYVAWQRGGGSASEIHVARLNSAGTAWEQVGGPLTAPNAGGAQPSLADVGGVPHVAFMETDEDGDFQVHVARLSGTDWLRVGETDDPAKPINESSSEDAFRPSLAAIGGVPYVAWVELDGSGVRQVRVARLNGAGTGWEKPGDSASPINALPSTNAEEPSLTGIGGVPFVAWAELNSSSQPPHSIHVAKLNGAGTAWDKVANASPINEQVGRDAREPSLTGIGGVPYVAWRENDAAGIRQVRVARLDGTGTAWEKVAGGASPINKASNGQATDPSITGIGGVPYVAWAEASPAESASWVARPNADETAWEIIPDTASPVDQPVGLADPSLVNLGGIPYVAYKGPGLPVEIQVRRLEPELQATAVPSSTGATFVAAVDSFGLPYQVGFQFGPNLVSETSTHQTVGETDLITETVTGLPSSTTFPFRAFAVAGVPVPKVLGATGQFSTLAGSAPPADTRPPELELGGKTTQKLGKAVKVKASCPAEACEATATGKLVASGGARPAGRASSRFALKPATADIAAGTTAALKLRIPAKARRAAAASLKSGGAARAKLAVTASDAGGNSATARRTVTLVR